jgi:hypothetical protein
MANKNNCKTIMNERKREREKERERERKRNQFNSPP